MPIRLIAGFMLLLGLVPRPVLDLTGYWSGTVGDPGAPLRFALRVVRKNGAIEALADLPDMGILGRSVSDLAVGGDSVSFRVAGIIVRARALGERLVGQARYAETEGTVDLGRAEPVPPPYRTEHVRFENGDVSLAGTLFLPQGAGPFPAVVVVHGSGAARRGDWHFIADLFSRRGIATLLYDKRGVGESTGDYRASSFEELADDGVAGFRMLQRRRDIDSARVGFWGLSQGAWIGPLAASRAGDAAFVVMISGGGLTPAHQEQRDTEAALEAAGFSKDDVEHAVAFKNLRDRYARTGEGWDEYRAAWDSARSMKWFMHPGTDVAGPPTKDHWLWRFLRLIYFYDPLPALRNLRCPTLTIFGALDTPVAVRENTEAVEQALRDGGSIPPDVRIFPGADHGLRVRPDSGPAKGWPRLAPGYVEAQVRWLEEVLRIGR